MQTKKRLARKTGLAKKRAKARLVRDRAPKPKAEAVKVYPDGREVCQDNAAGDREYKARTLTMALRQNMRCALCGKSFAGRVTFDHEDGRGLAGARRTDAIWNPDGTPLNAALCLWCNTAVKGSKRIAYPYQTSVTRSEWEARNGKQ